MKIMGLVALSIPCFLEMIIIARVANENKRTSRFGACSQVKDVQTGKGRGLVVCSVRFDIGL